MQNREAIRAKALRENLRKRKALIRAQDKMEKNTVKHTKMFIIGSGSAGYTAAIYGSRAMLEPILALGPQPGGQLTITTEVENFPSHKEIQGPELMELMREHADHCGATILPDTVERIDLNTRPFKLTLESKELYSADTIILATGAQARWLGLASEEHFKGFGVSACATCDGFFFRDKEVLVIGGGNTAVEEALFLTRFASQVTLVHRRDSLRAEKILQKHLFDNPKVKIIWDHNLAEIVGQEEPRLVTGARLNHAKSGVEQEIACDGIFIAIGHSPASSLVAEALTLSDGGYVPTRNGTTTTEIPGLFAAGDVMDPVFRQAITSAGFGCMAAIEAEKYLTEHPEESS